MTDVTAPKPAARSFQLEDAFRLEFFQDAQLSPDGQQLAYVLQRTDPEANDGDGADHCNIWLQNLADESAFPLTSGDHRDLSPRWSPDGKQISFISTRAGAPQLYLIAPDGGEARQLTHLGQGVGGPGVWSPDGEKLAFNAGPNPDDLPKPGAPYRITRHTYRFDSLGMLDRAVQSIYVIDAAGGEPTQLTDDGYMNTAPAWSPAGDALLYASTFPPTGERYMPGLSLVNLEGEGQQILWEGWQAAHFAWLPDGERIAFIGQETEQIPGTLDQLYTLQLSGGQPEQRSDLDGAVGGGLQGDMPSLAFRAGGLMISDDGNSAFVQVQDGGQVRVYRCALSGDKDCQPVIADDDHSAFIMDCDERQIIYISSSFTEPMQLHWTDNEGGNRRTLTQLNASILRRDCPCQCAQFHHPRRAG